MESYTGHLHFVSLVAIFFCISLSFGVEHVPPEKTLPGSAPVLPSKHALLEPGSGMPEPSHSEPFFVTWKVAVRESEPHPSASVQRER